MKRKIIKHLLLVVIMTVLCMAVGMTAEAEWWGDYGYKVINGEAHITSLFYNGGLTGTITIPETFDGYPVVSIGSYVFENCPNITEIVLPDSVREIGEGAFSNTAFYNNEDNWEDGVLYLGHFLLGSKEDITSCTVKEGTIGIAAKVFDDRRNLKSVTLPESLHYIHNEAFGYCTNLKNISVSSNNPYFCTDEYGVLFNKDKTVLIKYPVKSNLTSYTIPGSVKIICDWAFCAAFNLENITIPEGVEQIKRQSLSNCVNIKSLILPDSISVIEHAAFVGNVSLQSINIPKNVTEIPSSCFAQCFKLKSIIIPENVTYISDNVFDFCMNFKDMYILSDNIEIHPYAYMGKTGLDETIITVEEFVKFALDYFNGNLSEEEREIIITKFANATIIYETPITTLHGNIGSATEAYAKEKGYEFKAITDSVVEKDEDTNISADYPFGTFDVIPELKINEGGENANFVFSGLFSRYVSYDISFVAGEEEIQPNGTVRIKVPLPLSFSSKSTKVYHIDEKGNKTLVPSDYIDGFIVFKTDHFSEYVLVDESSKIEAPTEPDEPATEPDTPDEPSDTCSHMCHKTGISGILWKIVRFFWKLFKMNPVCECGVAHY